MHHPGGFRLSLKKSLLCSFIEDLYAYIFLSSLQEMWIDVGWDVNVGSVGIWLNVSELTERKCYWTI